LWRLPVVKHAEMDLGPCLTMALAMHPPGEQAYNVTFVKSFPESGRRGGLTIHGKDMGRMTKAWQRRGEPIPVVNILGHHPGFWLGSLHKTPYGDNEYESIGAFTGAPVRLAPSVTWGADFLVPADAEIIVEGQIIPGERTIVDPFGEISRQYQPQQFAPVMEITAITHRDGALFQDIFSGHREHMLMGSIPKEGSIYNHLQKKFGFIHAVNLPYSGCGRYTAYISVQQASADQAKQVALQALAYVPNLHVIVIVDDDIDVLSEEDVLWAANTYVDPARDVNVLHGIHEASDPRGMGASRVMIDATRPTHVAFPTRLRVPPDALARIKLDEWLDQAQGSI
jgi:UbiD family decarboxylase